MSTQTRDTAMHEQGKPPREYGGLSGGLGTDRLRRIAAGVLGGAFLVQGLRRRGLGGLAMALAGGWMLARALDRSPGKRAVEAASGTLSGLSDRAGGGEDTAISRTITIDEPAEDLYETWRDPDQLARIVGHFADVTATDEDLLRWTVEAPGGRTISWDTRIVQAEPGEFLRWETPGDAMVPSEGELRFRPAPGDQGTEVELALDVDPPGGVAGAVAMDRLDVLPEAVVGVALDRFKSLAETGEIPTLADNPSGRGRGDLV